MKNNYRYAWVVGGSAGRVLGGWGNIPCTLQNLLALIQMGYRASEELSTRLQGVQVNLKEWHPSVLLAVLPQGTAERYPEFCPVYSEGTMVAVLLR